MRTWQLQSSRVWSEANLRWSAVVQNLGVHGLFGCSFTAVDPGKTKRWYQFLAGARTPAQSLTGCADLEDLGVCAPGCSLAAAGPAAIAFPDFLRHRAQVGPPQPQSLAPVRFGGCYWSRLKNQAPVLSRGSPAGNPAPMLRQAHDLQRRRCRDHDRCGKVD